EEDLLDVLHFDQRIAHRSLTRSVESHWDMSERITASPSARPSTTSTVLTELRPSRTFARCASSPPLISLNSSVWPPGCGPAGRHPLPQFERQLGEDAAIDGAHLHRIDLLAPEGDHGLQPLDLRHLRGHLLLAAARDDAKSLALDLETARQLLRALHLLPRLY